MNSDERRRFPIRYLRGCGWFIAAIAIIGVAMFVFDIADTQKYPAVVFMGTIFCVFGSWWMFKLARMAESGEG